MAQQPWFVVRGGREEGPYTATQLKAMAASEAVKPNDKIRRSDVETARPASAVRGLFPEGEVARPKEPKSPEPDQPKQRSSRRWLVIGAVAVGVMVLMCGGVLTLFLKDQQAVQREMVEGNRLWESGDKAQAVAKYKELLQNGSRAVTLNGGELATAYGRVIDFECESGRSGEAEPLVAEAARKKLRLEASHPEAKRLLAREQARSRGELLTEEFYPFKPGTKQQTLGKLVLGNVTVQSRKEYTHEKGGGISVRWLNLLGLQGRSFQLPKPKKLLHRVRDGFVEIGEENEGLKQTVWRPIIKVGALAGDSWEREVIPGMTETYKVVRFGEPKFGPKEITFDGAGPKGAVFSAFVEVRTVADLGDGKSLVTTEEYELGRGIGPTSKAAFEGEGEGRKLNWSESLVPPLKK